MITKRSRVKTVRVFSYISSSTLIFSPVVRRKATRAEMLEEFSDFIPKFRSFIELAPDTINIWDMRAVPKLPTWTRGRVLLLGDAAHGTFPTLGQGAAMAVEEAATIGCLLPSGTTREQVPSRLEAHQILRKDRGDFVGQESAEQMAIPEKRGLYFRCKHNSHRNIRGTKRDIKPPTYRMIS
jgi:2-polyprenyl-6-methoxyphenol hydroxylase-like FAD-dependent oxidoreductase